jgi:thiol:disulfide interchange protein DsbA
VAIVSNRNRSRALGAAIAAVLILIAGCAEEPAPQAVEPAVANTAQPPIEESIEPASVAAQPPAPTTTPTQQPGRITLAQADQEPSTSRFQPGTHYQRFPSAQGTSSSPDMIEVAEIFWYGCPHCYTFDPYLEDWRQNIPEDVSFVRIPAVWNALLQIHARAFYAARALNVSDQLHTAFFREIHINRNGLDSQDALADFFAGHGVDPDEFNAAFESFAVNNFMNRADDLSRRYRVGSVPTVVVNGKYTTDAGMAGSYEDLMELIDELIAMERAGE